MTYTAKLKLTLWARIITSRRKWQRTGGDVDMWLLLDDLRLDDLRRSIPGPSSSRKMLWEQFELTAHPTGRKR
jgi:hypothetical protein